MEEYILSLDQGTTSSRTIIFDKNGMVVSKAQREFAQIYPKPGWVEHNPNDILASQLGTISEALALEGIMPSQIRAIGITNQRETTVVWNKKTGRTVYNAIVWQCRRTADYCKELSKQGLDKKIYQKTGLIIDAYFSATKLKWILDNVKGAREQAKRGDLLFGTVDTFLLWHLTKGKIHATDYTNASRTMLFNFHSLCWDDELLQLFDIPSQMLPKVYPSGFCYGYTDQSVVGAEIAIASILGDQQAALFGQLCLEEGDIKNTYGTGCFMLMNTGKKAVESKRGLITTLIAGLEQKPLYALEGSVFVGGAVVQWLRDEMRLIKDAADSEKYASRVPDSNGIYIVPAFVGLGAPYWDAEVRGTITGITRGVKKEHFVRAALEAIAYQTFDVFHAMERDSGVKINELSVDGGASANNFLMQFQSDISGVTVKRPAVTETTALGVCYLAGLTQGYWQNIDQIKQNAALHKRFYPHMEKSVREKLILGWAEAVAKARHR